MSEIDQFDISVPITCEPEQCNSYLINSAHYLKVLQQNIRSLNCNFQELQVLLERLKLSCDIIVLSECWLSRVSNLPLLQGYNSHKTNDNYNQNDGIVVYTNNNLKCTVEEPFLSEANCLMIKIKNDTIIIAIYRPPSFKSLDAFLDSLHNLLTTVSSFKNIIVVGDINIDLLGSGSGTTSYLETFAFHGLLPAINTATRDRTCLDHVILKTKLEALTFSLGTSITDHEAVLFCIKTQVAKPNSTTTKINLKIDIDKLKSECNNLKFDIVYQETNVNTAINNFINIIQLLIANNSIKRLIPRNKIIIKPWITTGMLRCIRTRDKMHMKLKTNNDVILKISYLRYRNYCNNLLKKLKKQYERSQLIMSKNNSKKLWSTIKTITNNNKNKQIPLQLLTTHKTPKESINNTNEYFSNIGKRLSNMIPPHISCVKKISKPPLNSFVLLPTDIEEVERTLQLLKSDCSPGWDQISADILKKISVSITPVLTDLINRCFVLGVFPLALKRAVVHPIHKAGDRGSVSNYRPIAILTTLSKIFERILKNRLTKYFEEYNLFSDTQYGFRAGRSTDNAVLDLVNFLVHKLDAKNRCLTIFLDLAKAFDTVSVPRLVQKLEDHGIRGVPLDLLSDYLKNRTQSVKIGEYISDELPVEFGVPQGSILGPTLFLCYVNELCSLKIKNCRISAYADDTALTFFADSWSELFALAQNGFNTVCHWLSSNHLTLNEDKTKYILHSIRNQSGLANHGTYIIHAHKCNFPPTPNCNCPNIKPTKSLKYLGVEIDSNLTFDSHIDFLSKRIRKLTYIFKGLRDVADKHTMRMVYEALVQSIIGYCITTWGGACKTKLIRVERAQRMILKVSLSKPRLFNTTTLYEEAQVLTVRQLYILLTALLQHSNLPEERRKRIGLSRRKFAVCGTTAVGSSFAQRFFSFRGGELYNKINKIINIANCSKVECKSKIIKWLLNLNYTETEKLLEVAK